MGAESPILSVHPPSSCLVSTTVPKCSIYGKSSEQTDATTTRERVFTSPVNILAAVMGRNPLDSRTLTDPYRLPVPLSHVRLPLRRHHHLRHRQPQCRTPHHRVPSHNLSLFVIEACGSPMLVCIHIAQLRIDH